MSTKMMKASELVCELQRAIDAVGDQEVLIIGCYGSSTYELEVVFGQDGNVIETDICSG